MRTIKHFCNINSNIKKNKKKLMVVWVLIKKGNMDQKMISMSM